MNLQKVLAENMIRFGTKNLTATQKKKLLKEQLDRLNLAALVATDEIKSYIDIDNDTDKDHYNIIFQFLKDNGVIFSITQSDAAYIIVYHGTYPGYGDRSLGGRSYKTSGKFSLTDRVKLMDSPEDTTKVYTQGNVFPERFENPKDRNGQSDYFDLIKYCNNHALLDLIEGSENQRNGVWLRVSPDTGMAYFSPADNSVTNLYGTIDFTAAKSNQVVNTTVFTIPAVGKAIEKLFPGSIFATNEITLADSTELDKAIAELTTLSQDKTIKITGITIQSGASGDRAVGNKSGYPKESDVAAGTYTLTPSFKPYRPKTPTESGNARLAYGRAKTIESKLGTLAPITIDYHIANGGDAAQYAKIIANIEKTDSPATTLTKQDLENILLQKKQVTDLSSTKNVKGFSRKNG
jgi:hypothetical protein